MASMTSTVTRSTTLQVASSSERAVTAFSMRGRLISPEGEPSLAPFPSPLGHGLYPRATSTLRGRVDPVRGAIDERQEELRERRDEIYHINQRITPHTFCIECLFYKFFLSKIPNIL